MKKGLRVRISEFKKVISFAEKYDFLHFGSETCENLVFYYKKYLTKLMKVEKELIISFPPLSETVFRYLQEFLVSLKDIYKKKTIAFSVNDFGTFEFIKKFFPSSEILIGRHLSKAFFSLSKEKLTVNSLSSIRFFKRYYNISKYEISSFERPPLTNLEKLRERRLKIEFFIHYPYVLLSTARNCIVGFNDLPPHHTTKGVECDKACMKGGYKVDIGIGREYLYLFENSVYKKITADIFKLRFPEFFKIAGVVIDPFI